MKYILFSSLVSYIVSASNYIIQFNNKKEVSYKIDKFFTYESMNIINSYNIGDISGYIMKYDSFPVHLYNYDFIEFIEEDKIISIDNFNYDGFFDYQYDEFSENFDPERSFYLQKNPIWNLDRLDQRDNKIDSKYYYYTSSGKNVNVYVVDTGIDISHPEFGGRAVWGSNTVDSINNDCNGHGTHVSGSVGSKSYGVAKNTNLIAVKVLDCNGSGSYSGVISGLEFVLNSHKKSNSQSVVNMSLGGPKSDIINNILKKLVSSGIHVVVAAGNENSDACNTSPASESTVMTVGATTKDSKLAYFSNWGTCVDILSPGTEIMSTLPNKKIGNLQGTSMASPQIAGIYALILSDNSSLNPDTMKKLMTSRCSKDFISGVKNNTPNCLGYSLS